MNLCKAIVSFLISQSYHIHNHFVSAKITNTRIIDCLNGLQAFEISNIQSASNIKALKYQSASKNNYADFVPEVFCDM